MISYVASQVRGNIQKFPAGTVGGVWKWTLTGPSSQNMESLDGTPWMFDVDEVASPGEYVVTLQRFDELGVVLGVKSSSPFQVHETPEPDVDIEVPGDVTVSVAPTARKKKK